MLGSSWVENPPNSGPESEMGVLSPFKPIWEPPGGLLGASWGLLGASWGPPGGFMWPPNRSKRAQEGPRGLQMAPSQRICCQAASNSQFDRFYDAQMDEYAILLNKNICICPLELLYFLGKSAFLFQASMFDGLKHHFRFGAICRAKLGSCRGLGALLTDFKALLLLRTLWRSEL